VIAQWWRHGSVASTLCTLGVPVTIHSASGGGKAREKFPLWRGRAAVLLTAARRSLRVAALGRPKLRPAGGRVGLGGRWPGLPAFLANQSPGEIVHACRRHVGQGAEIDIARRQGWHMTPTQTGTQREFTRVHCGAMRSSTRTRHEDS
jgi:hypothetical protein